MAFTAWKPSAKKTAPVKFTSPAETKRIADQRASVTAQKAAIANGTAKAPTSTNTYKPPKNNYTKMYKQTKNMSQPELLKMAESRAPKKKASIYKYGSYGHKKNGGNDGYSIGGSKDF